MILKAHFEELQDGRHALIIEPTTELYRLRKKSERGNAFEVDVKVWRDKRSHAQNRFYWRMLGEVCQYLGELDGVMREKESVHDEMKIRFIFRPVITKIGTHSVLTVRSNSSAKLTVEQFSIFISEVEKFWMERLGISFEHLKTENYVS